MKFHQIILSNEVSQNKMKFRQIKCLVKNVKKERKFGQKCKKKIRSKTLKNNKNKNFAKKEKVGKNKKQNKKTFCESLAKINFAYQNFSQKKR